MKLYYSPGACSMASHIALTEAGLKFQTEKVNMKIPEKTTATGQSFMRINPKGYVPALETQTGEVLTEGAAILQYIADRAPEKELAPRAGTFERYKLQEWLTFISSEVHKGMSPLFNPKTPDAYREIAKANLSKRLDWLQEQLQGRTFLMGQTFTVADAYLFTVLGWSKMLGVDMTKWPGLMGYVERVGARPSVRETMKAEGLI